MFINNDTICALATSSGQGAISVIRLSGCEAILICNQFFTNKDLTKVDSHTLHFGTIRKENKILDEVVVSVFRNPHSYTGEDVIEIHSHMIHSLKVRSNVSIWHYYSHGVRSLR